MYQCRANDRRSTYAGLHQGPTTGRYPSSVAKSRLDADRLPRTSAVYRGRLSGLYGLGYLARADSAGAGSDRALEYLRASLKPSDWTSRNLPWVAGGEDAVELSIASVHALSITGDDEAQALLREIATGDVEDRTRYAAESALAGLAATDGHQ